MTIQTDASTKGWRAYCNEISTGEKWLKKEQEHHINVLELMDVKFAVLTFPQKSLKFNYSYPDEQQSCFIVSLENRGYTQCRAFKNQQVNLPLSTASWDHNYCRIFTKQIECPRRLGVSECQGFLRLETASKHNQTFWISNSGPLCM